MNTRNSQLYGVGLNVEVQRVNMKLQMELSKRTDGLSVRNLLHVFRLNDKDGSGVLSQDQFTKALKQYK